MCRNGPRHMGRSIQPRADAGRKKAVILYKALQSYEKGVKSIQAVRSACDRLSRQHRRPVTNCGLLEDYEARIDGSALFF